MSNRLVIYELTLFQRSFADAFSRTRDKLLLLVMAGLVVLWLRERALTLTSGGLPERAVFFAGLAAPVAFAWQRTLLRRLQWLEEYSLFALHALMPETRRGYLAAAQLPILAPLIAGVAILASGTSNFPAAAGIGIAGWATGVAAASWSPLHPERSGSRWPEGEASAHSAFQGRGAVVMAILRSQLFNSAHPGWLASLILAGSGLFACAGMLLAGAGRPHLVLWAGLVPSLAVLLVSARNDAGLAGFLPFAGYSAASTALAVSALPAANFTVASVAALIVRPVGWLSIIGLLLVLHSLAALIAIARAWLSPGRDSRSVNARVQLELAGLIVMGLLLPPLALLALCGRMGILYRRYTSLLWVQL